MQSQIVFCLKTSNRRRVIKELDRFIHEWREWEAEVANLGSDPVDHFDPRPGRPYLDGEANIKRHNILQAKTLALLDENVEGHGFICGRDGQHIDRTDLRLNIRVKHRLTDLDELRARIEYAEVPPGIIRRTGTKIGTLIPDMISDTIAKAIKGFSSGS